MTQTQQPLSLTVENGANTIDMDVIARLTQENQQLKQATETVREAILFATHEWRNCLTRVSLASEHLTRVSSENTEQQNVLQRIRRTTAEMERITLYYLDVALMEGSFFRIYPRFIDPVREIIEPILASFDELCVQRRQTFEIKVSQPGLLVWADPELLNTVYENLIGNALKYGEEGGRIVLEIYERGNLDEFRVWNSGPGIPSSELEYIFERFTRGINSKSERGMGIGLYLTHRIVQAHGGRLWAESKHGAWANFIFTLPKRGADLRELEYIKRDLSGQGKSG